MLHQSFQGPFDGGQLSLEGLRDWMRSVEAALQQLQRLQVASPLRLIDGPGGPILAMDDAWATTVTDTTDPVEVCGPFRWCIDTPTTWSANQHNLELSDRTIQRVSADAARDLTGIAGGQGGLLRILWNVGDYTITLKHQSSSSTSTNRLSIEGDGDMSLPSGKGAFCLYDDVTCRWRVTNFEPSSWRIDTPATWTANQNDLTLTTPTIQRISSDAARDLTGIASGSEGRLRILWNVGSYDITLKHQGASSSAANRFIVDTGADLTLGPAQIAWLVYDSVSTRWRVAGIGSASGSSIATSCGNYSTTDDVLAESDTQSLHFDNASGIYLEDYGAARWIRMRAATTTQMGVVTTTTQQFDGVKHFQGSETWFYDGSETNSDVALRLTGNNSGVGFAGKIRASRDTGSSTDTWLRVDGPSNYSTRGPFLHLGQEMDVDALDTYGVEINASGGHMALYTEGDIVNYCGWVNLAGGTTGGSWSVQYTNAGFKAIEYNVGGADPQVTGGDFYLRCVPHFEFKDHADITSDTVYVRDAAGVAQTGKTGTYATPSSITVTRGFVTAISAGSAVAGGHLSGTYPNPTIAKPPVLHWQKKAKFL